MTKDEEVVAMHKLHQVCQELIVETNNIQRVLWAAVYEKLSPDFDKVFLSAVEANHRSNVLLRLATDMREQGEEMLNDH